MVVEVRDTDGEGGATGRVFVSVEDGEDGLAPIPCRRALNFRFVAFIATLFSNARPLWAVFQDIFVWYPANVCFRSGQRGNGCKGSGMLQ